MSEQPSVKLPATLIGRVDLARLIREIETVDNDFEVQKVRDHKTEATYSLPTMSRSLSDFLELNKINIADAQQRMALKDGMRMMKDKLPLIRMIFAAEPEPDFLQQLVAWIRQEIHPGALLAVGLQPGLIGGVYMRTPNHIHDFSVRKLLASKRGILAQELEKVLNESQVQPAPEEVVEAKA